jgi:hypothetical protein
LVRFEGEVVVLVELLELELLDILSLVQEDVSFVSLKM